MINSHQSGSQFEIEARYARFANHTFDESKTMAEVFGPLEEWTLEVGAYQLVLMPLTGQWWYLDSVHETWENTGQQAGEVEFYLEGDLLEGRPLEAERLPEARQPEPLAPAEPPVSPPQPPEPPAVNTPGSGLATEAPTQVSPDQDPELNTPTLTMPAPQIWRLVVLTGPKADQSYELGLETRLGRIADNEIVLADTLSSRQHARILRLGSAYVISDLGSSNGTYVNGQQIQEPVELKPQDEIIIGSTKLRVEA